MICNDQSIEDLQPLLQCVWTDHDDTVEVESIVLDDKIAYTNIRQERVKKSLVSMGVLHEMAL